jgi:hypothetical protein
MRGSFRGLRWMTVTALVVPLLALTASSASATTGAVSTTDNAGYVGPNSYVNQQCANGNGINCNIYEEKPDVWLSGLPDSAHLNDGTFFFAVLDPGGQQDPNDGTSGNLSNSDSYSDRSFTLSGGVITNIGTHAFDSNKLQAFPYDDTSNPGGVYILAVCQYDPEATVGDPPPGVDPSDCKYDAFKVRSGAPAAEDLVVTKDAATSLDRTYSWKIEKKVDKTTVKQVGGQATFNYTITVGQPDPASVDSNWQVTGSIDVFNPNLFAVSGVTVTDSIDNNGTCVVTNGTGVTVPASSSVTLSYSCTYLSVPDPSSGTNTATATWFEGSLKHVSGDAGYDFASATVDQIDECVDVTDTFAGDLGTVCVGDTIPHDFTYSRTVNVPSNGCQSYDNTATFTTNDTGTTGSASQTVSVCGPARTGALTIGFWKTTNGQNLIKTYCQNPALANYLRGLGSGSGPFADAPTTSCTALASYVSGILTKASATDMNKMLKAQMLGTALDVWFSGPGWTSTKIGSVKPPSTFLQHNNLGTFKMDTTAVCPMVDNLNTGTATCKNAKPSTDAVVAGAVPTSPMSMQAILDFAATTPSPFNGSTSSSIWYGGNRTKEEILKNIFDQFNNQDAFGSF